MCRHRGEHLPPVPASVGHARRYVSDALEEWAVDDGRDVATLLVSELVTNAVVHARSPITMTVSLAGDDLELAVGDNDPRMPVRRPTLAPDGLEERLTVWEAESGRGVSMVDALADEWGVTHLSRGKQVWFRLAVGSTWAERAACLCGGDAAATDGLTTYSLATGRTVVDMAGWGGPPGLPRQA